MVRDATPMGKLLRIFDRMLDARGADGHSGRAEMWQGGGPLKLVVFDCDGTLVDSQGMICAAMQRTYDAHGLPVPPRERVLSIVGLSLHEAFSELAGDEAHPVASMVERYKAIFAELRMAGDHPETLFPGAREAVERLAAQSDLLLGMATGKSQRGVKAVLEPLGLYRHFHTIQTADDGPSKPHPAMVEQAMRAAGAIPARTVVVGDTVYDVAMARAAGATAIGVAWGYHAPAALRDAGAVAVLTDFQALHPVLERLWGTVEA